MTKEGIYFDLSSDSYHADKGSISRSSIMDFKKSPKYYWSKHLNPTRPVTKPTPSMIFGSAFHALILEPELFRENYFVMPKASLLKEVGREEFDRIKEERKKIRENGGILLGNKEYACLCEMRDALDAHCKTPHLLYDGINESSYFWRDLSSGMMCKSRPDVLHSNIYVDLKTCADASEEAFQRSMARFGNHIQAAMVCDGVSALTGRKIEGCINVCIETSYPYSIGIYVIDELAIETGREEYKRILLELKHAYRYNEFTDLPIKTVGLPRWYI